MVRYRNWIMAITLVLAGVCGLLMLHVNINSDMTQYLPDDSRMRAGLEIMQNEFGMSTDMAGANVRVMTEGQTQVEQVDMQYALRQLPEVESVTLQENGNHTLYELSTPKSTNQVALGKEISAKYAKVTAVETAQDGTTADAPMLIGALTLLLLVLAAMCASWLEPVLFLASTGIAVLLNTGTNALLPSVSATTNSIAAILQLVLSMDYSIILINRFRQERQLAPDSPTAMQQAIGKAAPSILSSALTTIVGLMMLVFMKLKIGADLGIVLSKGVFCSMVCNFTLLPSLILLCERGIDRTQKRVLHLPTDRLAQWSMKYRIPLALFFVALLCGSYVMHNQTPISFLNAQPSAINDYFPKKNPVVLIYDNADEDQVVELIDSLTALPGVEMALSYPSLMLRKYTAPKLVAAIQDMSTMVNSSDSTMPSLPLDLLTDETMQLVYFAANGQAPSRLSFGQIANFILAESRKPQSLVANQMSPDMKQKLSMLDDFLLLDNETLTESAIDSAEAEVFELAEALDIEPSPVENTEVEPAEIPPTLIIEEPSVPQSPFQDTALIRKQMSPIEMSQYLGMESGQAKMAYRLAKSKTGTLSPLQFVHFLTDDILKRKALASMISDEQRDQLLTLRATMDSANSGQSQSRESQVAHADAPASRHIPAMVSHTEPTPQPLADTTAASIEETLIDDDPLTLLDEMMSGNGSYTAREMARNFSAMGEPVSPSMMELLYLYYGSTTRYDTNWTMSLDEVVHFLGDSMMNAPRFAGLITPDMRSSFASMQNTMQEKLSMMRSTNKSIAVIVTSLPTESEKTYDFINQYRRRCDRYLPHGYYAIGESVMLDEMKSGFSKEMLLVTLLTILAIAAIVAVSFRSLLLALLLVATVMAGVFVDVWVSSWGGGSLLYMAYLVVQSILMGAAIDYGILFANYYREKRLHSDIPTALRESYQGSTHTILTSGLILILVPGAMSVLVDDATVASIVRSISVGALATVILMLLVLPGLLATCDRFVQAKGWSQCIESPARQ